MVGNTHEIQNGRNPVRDWFIPVATKVKPDIAKGSTAQGKYVIAADGTAYGFNNNRSIERVHQLLDRSLAQFKASPPVQVAISAAELEAKFVPEPPIGSAVVRLFTRVKPAPLGSDSANENVARDHFWILPEELKALSTGEMPEAFRMRLARFALVDSVRGEPDHWRPAEIVRAEFKLSPLRSSKVKGFSLTGTFSMQTQDLKRGYEGKLEGELTFGTENRLVSFKAFAEGQAWGASTYAPNPPAGKFPLLIAFVSVSDEASRVVAPQAVFYGREYLTGR
ncbi:MAG: hypothetical protein H7Y17_00505 [Chlorobia bacterium]|nr:hypothetical protein [Fimbriimonadaceae bacterium]